MLVAEGNWNRLDTIGTDQVRIELDPSGWSLNGRASYSLNNQTIEIHYEIKSNPDANARSGRAHGTCGNRRFDYRIERDAHGWRLNSKVQSQVASLVDLDFGFTPSTNFTQLKRMNLAIGESQLCVVAWFDIDQNELIALPQTYKRISQIEYQYESPTAGYRAVLKVAPNGLVSLYPNLWSSTQVLREYQPRISMD